jgi:hypothetical protein
MDRFSSFRPGACCRQPIPAIVKTIEFGQNREAEPLRLASEEENQTALYLGRRADVSLGSSSLQLFAIQAARLQTLED